MRLRLLTRTSFEELTDQLRRGLDPSRFEMRTGTMERSPLEQIIEEAPDIVLLEFAPWEVPNSTVVRAASKISPHLKIIFMSSASSPLDAYIVEQGLFYYTARPELEEIFEVLGAAERAIHRGREAQRPGARKEYSRRPH